MTAGMVSKGRIIRFSNPSDDDQGGAVPTGTVLYDPVFARISEKRGTQALLEQGLETPSIYNAIFEPGTMALESNDVYEDHYYPASPYYGKKFVIIGVHLPSMMDNRRYVTADLRRFDTAHSENLQ
jgi:hypothetical protein